MADPIVDKASALERLDGDEALYQEIVKVFLADTVRQLQIFRAALGRGDREELTRIAHSLKSASATIGAEQMRRIAGELERTGPVAAVAQLSDRFEQLEQAFQAVAHHFSES